MFNAIVEVKQYEIIGIDLSLKYVGRLFVIFFVMEDVSQTNCIYTVVGWQAVVGEMFDFLHLDL